MDAARSNSMTRAAEMNYISRPAVSHAIRNLEDELKSQLVRHQRRAFELTQAGVRLLNASEGIFREVDAAKSKLQEKNMKFSGQIRIGCVRSLTSMMLPRALGKLRKKYPQVLPRVVIANSETLMEQLNLRQIDVALVLGDDTVHGAQEIVIDHGSFVLAVPLGRDPSIIPYAVTERRPETERARTLYSRKFGKEMEIYAEVPSWDSIISWIKLGECGGVIPRFLLQPNRKQEKIGVIIEKVFPYEIKAVYFKVERTEAVIEDLVNFCTKLEKTV